MAVLPVRCKLNKEEYNLVKDFTDRIIETGEDCLSGCYWDKIHHIASLTYFPDSNGRDVQFATINLHKSRTGDYLSFGGTSGELVLQAIQLIERKVNLKLQDRVETSFAVCNI